MKTRTTRYLLSCAAIGAAGAVLLIPANNFAVALGAALPFLYAVMVGVWLLPPALAVALIRRPGAGVLTAAMAGVVTSPLNPAGPAALVTAMLVGMLFEVPFAVGGYRRWSWWLFQISALVTALIFVPNVWGFYDLGLWHPVAVFALIALVIANCGVFVWIAGVLAARVEATGVTRGLTTPRSRPARPDTQEFCGSARAAQPKTKVQPHDHRQRGRGSGSRGATRAGGVRAGSWADQRHDKMVALGMTPVPSIAALARILRQTGVFRAEPR